MKIQMDQSEVIKLFYATFKLSPREGALASDSITLSNPNNYQKMLCRIFYVYDERKISDTLLGDGRHLLL